MKKHQRILKDQHLKGLDKVMWWIEYVIRHRGAKHLRSPAADMTFFQYFLLDVIAVFLLQIILIAFALYKFVILVRYRLQVKLKFD